MLHAVFASVCAARVTCAVRVPSWSRLEAHGVRVSAVRSSKLDFSWCASFAADSRQIKAQEVVAGDRTGALGHLQRALWNSGRNLYQHVFKSILAGMKLTQRWQRFCKQINCEVESAL